MIEHEWSYNIKVEKGSELDLLFRSNLSNNITQMKNTYYKRSLICDDLDRANIRLKEVHG